MLNRIALYYSINKINSLESQIQEALVSWNNRKDTRDLIPQWIVFSLDKENEGSELRYIVEPYNLEVCFRKDVTRNHFKIEGES